MPTAYIQKLRALVACDTESPSVATMNLEQRVASIVGSANTACIPDLQRLLDADPRAIGAILRAQGFRRKRSWTGDDYALTVWHKAPAQ